MKTIQLKVLDSKVMGILESLEKLNLVELMQVEQEIAPNSKDDFFEAVGIWKDKQIDADELREKAWKL